MYATAFIIYETENREFAFSVFFFFFELLWKLK